VSTFTQARQRGNRVIENPFNPEVAKNAKPTVLVDSLRSLNVRAQLDGSVFGMDALVDGWNGFSGPQLVSALRQQFWRQIAHLPAASRRRLRYLAPRRLRQLMADYVAVTFLPGLGRSNFPRGIEFWDLERVECLSLSLTLDVPAPHGTIDRYETRLHRLELDPRNWGRIKLGGSYVEDGVPHSRTMLSRMLSTEPGRTMTSVPPSRVDVIESSIAAHEDVELAASGGWVGSRRPVFPEVYLGFPGDDFPVQFGPALERRAYQNVDRWLRHGCPRLPFARHMDAWPDDMQERLHGIDPDQLSGWSTVAGILSADDASFLLGWSALDALRKYDGLHLAPASIVEPAGFAQAKRAYMRVADHLGRDVTQEDGTRSVDAQSASIQVIRLTSAGELAGTAGSIDYDLASNELGMEAVMG
jgi:hypothetical protein